ncbi:MAG: hypothetical protein Q8R55_05580 [Candidatus Taylorbacteria bacterium]|nr:hypothetical protein [Candidatus Taylorbacteria bacterium]
MNFKKHSLIIFLAVAALTAGGAAYYFYEQLSALKNDPGQMAKVETDKLVARVGKLIILPEGETPTIATVADPNKLAGQLFFGKAKKGDKVLIYAGAKKAVLYSPEENKVVEVSPINIGSPEE